jgi:superfamily II RNA helicase
MVKICDTEYPLETDKYNEHFDNYQFPLSSFQKYAIESIVEGNHVLITAHTGSGKTLPAEFAIEYFVSKGKKVIYTSPIKSLSNQKFYEFGKKFPHISFGILTGDIKTNPDADVLIMTTEILQNTLYNKTTKPKDTQLDSSFTSFNMDIEQQVGCVIFDEIHYINDPERGRVWEETIIMLPHTVQMVMLSATIDAPEKFALWCETQHQESNKIVYLASTYERIVPLTHYAFLCTNSTFFKALKDKTKEEDMKKNIFNKLLVIQTSDNKFQEPVFHTIKNTLTLLTTKQSHVKRQMVLNEVCKKMVQDSMLPALCFVLSRKMLEQCAHEITVPLLEDDSKVGYVIEYECEQIIRKLPNYKEYLNLPEYIKMVALLQKGIAIHHAGVMPVLREMVELLYSKGYIKLLFATETFAVGINMPTKTVLFTDICKFDGTNNRLLFSHEYTQMAGRAGRRGIDVVGNVIHLPNLFREFELIGFKKMMKGSPQKLVSKFKISYNLILNIILNNLEADKSTFLKYVGCSMIQNEIDSEVTGITFELKKKEEELEKMRVTFKHLRTPLEKVNEYIQLIIDKPNSVNKKRKDIERSIQKLVDEYKFIENDKMSVLKYNEKNKEHDLLKQSYQNASQYISANIDIILSLLIKQGLINIKEDMFSLTLKGSNASHLREINCLLFSDLIDNDMLNKFTSKQLAAIFSCFTNITVNEEYKSLVPRCADSHVESIASIMGSSLQEYLKDENDYKIRTGTSYDIHYDLLNYIGEWWDCADEPSCKFLLQKIENEKGIFLGEFVKALLKINNISTELESIAETTGQVELLHKLKEIPLNTLKFVATNQSLYV